MKQPCSDNQAYRYPVSIKGIIAIDGKIPLLKNERNEFELPGGKLEIHEQPIECLAREIKEELNLTVQVREIVDTWLYVITPEVRVVIVTYGCVSSNINEQIKISHEHKELVMVGMDEIDCINMPEGYKQSIKTWKIKNLVRS